MARTGKSKSAIKGYIEAKYGYDLSRTCDEIRPVYDFDVSCQGTVPEAIIAFLEANDFEDSVRTAISLGGDSDTLAAITASTAHAMRGVPAVIEALTRAKLDNFMIDKQKKEGGDALVSTILFDRIGSIRKHTRHENIPAHTVFVIITDGYENSSTMYTYSGIKRMIEHEKEKYGREFLIRQRFLTTATTQTNFTSFRNHRNLKQ